jgi:dUTPase
MVIAQLARAELSEVSELSSTTRAGGGFGSTGR